MDKLYKKGLFLEYFTVGYNIIEAAVLIGFGLDRVVKSLSAAILLGLGASSNCVDKNCRNSL